MHYHGRRILDPWAYCVSVVMFLKRLELQGYKTFAARTEFAFDSGVTAIVGPNGSGKSNIADALRWVMGEKRYSTLRAKRSEDMVFAGSQGRTAMGMAEVSLTLDNSTGWLPIEYTEVTVQRRTFRSGETEYYLNGSRARQRDIIELLAKGGVSSNTYTIIGQGAVDAALSMKVQERRDIFEEAAGIAIYRARRDQSLAKLEVTRSNIVRVNDIINEITPRLESLRRQAERAGAYQETTKELQELLETWHGYRWREAQEELGAAGAEEADRKEALRRHKRDLELISRQIEELRDRQTQLRGELGRWHSDSGLLHGRLEELQRELAVKRERQRLLVQQNEEIGQDLTPLAASRETRLQRIAELETELDRLSSERQEREAEAEAVRAEMAQVQDERRRLEGELAAAQDKAFGVATHLADGRNRLAHLGERKEELRREHADHEAEVEGLQAQLDELGKNIGNLEAECEALSTRSDELRAQEADEQAASEACQGRQSELRARLEKARESLSKLDTRYELLSKLRSELADYSRGVRTILSHRRELRGVVSTVAEAIEVPRHLEAAVEAALGDLLQAVIVESWQEAEDAVHFLAESEGGQATFLPLDSLEASRPESLPDAEGVLGLASELIGIRDGFEGVPLALLGDTVVVNDLSTARLLRKDHGKLRLVTLAGQLVSRSGSLTGGSTRTAGSLLSRERELRQLPEQIEKAKADKGALEEDLRGEEQRYQGLLGEIATLVRQREKLEATIRAEREEIGSWRLRMDRVSQEIEWRKVAQRRLRREMKSLEEREQDCVKGIRAGQSDERETAEVIDSLQEQILALDVLALQGKAAELRTAIAVLERSMESQDAALQGHRTGLEQLGSQMAAKESRIEELSDEAETLGDQIATLATQIEELSQQVESLSASMGPAEEELATLEAEEHRVQRAETDRRGELEAYEAAYNSSLVRRQRCEDELRNLRERIQADLEMVTASTDWAAEASADVDAHLESLPPVTEIPEGLDSKIKELKTRLRKIGPANLEAPAEYQQVLERHTFLMGQVEDLEGASQSLRGVVAELDRLMQERFLETFRKVAGEFETYFARLSNGGKAKLALIDPENPLESGVEIFAQPPGRRRSTVAMLSGGERSLTGVALTFAILKACGTPFCLLDEVDSQLDEINIGRFRQALRELSEKTQVIVITHNRGTVEIADAVYGITMAGDSTSRVLSLRLDEAKAQAL